MKYNNLLTIVKRLNQQQAKAERANSAAGASQGMTSAQRARLSDKSTIESWERDSVDTDDLAQRRSEEAMQREVDDKHNWQAHKTKNWIKD